MDGQDRPVVKVFVRKGHDANHRRLSFEIPSGISQPDLLTNGFAIDGNQAVIVVSVAGNGLLRTERDLVDALHQSGYRAEFV